jgi:hypothetical protein
VVNSIEREPWPFGRRLGYLRLRSQDILPVFERFEEKGFNIDATTKKHKFESLLDMKENLSLIVGDVSIRLTKKSVNSWDYVGVDFKACTVVYNSGRSEKPPIFDVI